MPSTTPILDPLDPQLLESHPALFRVERYDDGGERYLVVEQAFEEGETLCNIEGWTRCVIYVGLPRCRRVLTTCLTTRAQRPDGVLDGPGWPGPYRSHRAQFRSALHQSLVHAQRRLPNPDGRRAGPARRLASCGFAAACQGRRPFLLLPVNRMAHGPAIRLPLRGEGPSQLA